MGDDPDRDRHRHRAERDHCARPLALVAIGGGYGTLSEIAFGLQFGKTVLALAAAPPLAGVEAIASVDAVLDRVARVVLELPADG